MIKVKTTFLLLVAHLASLVASQLEFINFPLNLTLPISQSFDLHWHGQDSYVNISLAQFYYFGGGSEVRDYITSSFVHFLLRRHTKSNYEAHHPIYSIQ